MSSRIGEFSEELVHKAMTNVKCKDIDAWLDRAFMKNDKKILEQNQEQLCREEACNF
jgi:oligoendopeptidase F